MARSAKGKSSSKDARARRKKSSASRVWVFRLTIVLIILLGLWTFAGLWYVHHGRKWLTAKAAAWPRLVTQPLLWIGNPIGDLTDALGWTGHDAVYEYDEEAPTGAVAFAGYPKRMSEPAPSDIVPLTRGEFTIGWSPRLRHPVWCAYHVPAEAQYDITTRPNFIRDRAVPSAPPSSSYEKSGYDRGHLAPNFAIASRFGNDAQRLTFQTTNIAPQTPQLNRGVWRDLEHRIAELWTARYGEIWVIVGCIPSYTETLCGTDIDVPSQFYQVVVAQEGLDIRAFAVLFDQNVAWSDWPTRHLITIDELEEITGLDFLPDLPDFIQSPLEAELPSRLWPIRPQDIFKEIALRFYP